MRIVCKQASKENTENINVDMDMTQQPKKTEQPAVSKSSGFIYICFLNTATLESEKYDNRIYEYKKLRNKFNTVRSMLQNGLREI